MKSSDFFPIQPSRSPRHPFTDPLDHKKLHSKSTDNPSSTSSKGIESLETLASTVQMSDTVTKKRKQEQKLLDDLNMIWSFLDTSTKGPIMDVYDYLLDLSKNESPNVRKQSSSILEYLDGTRMRGY